MCTRSTRCAAVRCTGCNSNPPGAGWPSGQHSHAADASSASSARWSCLSASCSPSQLPAERPQWPPASVVVCGLGWGTTQQQERQGVAAATQSSSRGYLCVVSNSMCVSLCPLQLEQRAQRSCSSQIVYACPLQLELCLETHEKMQLRSLLRPLMDYQGKSM